MYIKKIHSITCGQTSVSFSPSFNGSITSYTARQMLSHHRRGEPQLAERVSAILLNLLPFRLLITNLPLSAISPTRAKCNSSNVKLAISSSSVDKILVSFIDK